MVDLTVLCEKTNKYGVYTGNNKPMYVFRFKDLLAHNAISYHEELICANPFQGNKTPKERAIASKVEFERQLKSFRRIHTLAPSLSAISKVWYTGKADKDNQHTSRLRDDMVMAALLGIYFASQHTMGYVKERGYNRQFVLPGERPEAPVIGPTRKRTADNLGNSQGSEMHSYVQAASRKKIRK